MNENRRILSSKDISSKITRIAHEIIEHHNDLSNLVMLGIHNRGVPIAGRLRKLIQDFTDIKIQLGSLDITFHRDDFRERLARLEMSARTKGEPEVRHWPHQNAEEYYRNYLTLKNICGYQNTSI